MWFSCGKCRGLVPGGVRCREGPSVPRLDGSGQIGKPSNSFIADFLGTALLKVKMLILSSILIYSLDINNEILHQVHLKCI